MSKSERLGLKHLRHAYRLVGECRELAAASRPERQWWQHMLTGLCPLVGAQVGIAGVLRNFGTPHQQIVSVEDVGWTGAAERRHFLRYQAEGGERRDPAFREFAGCDAPLVTRDRKQLVDDSEWYSSPIYHDYLKLAGIDGKIMSLCTLSTEDSLSHLLTLKRPPGGADFGLRELRLVHLFHHELNIALGSRLVSLASPAAEAGLPPRLRQVLQCLLAGDSEKQVACRLGLSVHTVHEHVKRLHRHFGVSSRGELLAHCHGTYRRPTDQQ